MTRTLSPPSAAMGDIRAVVGINKGGLGSELPDMVAANLDAISTNRKDIAGGVIGLDNNGKIPSSKLPVSSVKHPTLKGPSEIAVGQVAAYQITNFDSKTTYNVSASAGSVSVTGGYVGFTAPLTPQDVTLTINGRTVTIPIVAVRPSRPVIYLSDYGVADKSAIIMSSSSFSPLSGSGTHKATDWEISLNPTFTNTVFSSYNDQANTLSHTAGNLNLNTEYYARCRHIDNSDVKGSWSKPVKLTTKSSYVVDKELAKLIATDRSSNNELGYDVVMSSDGSRIAIGAWQATNGGTNSTGAIYIFARAGQLWSQEAKLYASDFAAGDKLGSKIAMNRDGSRLVATSFSTSGSGGAGSVYVFLRSGTNWIQEAKIMAADRVSGDAFGSALSINEDATRIAVGSPGSDTGGLSNNGVVYIFSRAGIVWSQEAKLAASDAASTDGFGSSVSLTRDSARLVVGAPNADISGVVDAGAVYVFTRANTVWTQEAKLTATARATSDRLGTSVSICSKDADRIVVGAIGSSSPSNADSCFAIVFKLTNTTWAQEVKLQATQRLIGDEFGCDVDINSNGTKLVVGARLADINGFADAGAAFVFARSSAGWAEESRLTASDRSVNSGFGKMVSITSDGSRVLVGSHLADPSNLTNAGSAYVFGN